MIRSILFTIIFLFSSNLLFAQDIVTDDYFVKKGKALLGNIKSICVYYGTEEAWNSDELPDIEIVKQKLKDKIPSLNILGFKNSDECDAELAFGLSKNKSPMVNEFYGNLNFRVLRKAHIINSVGDYDPNVVVWTDGYEYYTGIDKTERIKSFEQMIDSLIDKFAVQYYKNNSQ